MGSERFMIQGSVCTEFWPHLKPVCYDIDAGLHRIELNWGL